MDASIFRTHVLRINWIKLQPANTIRLMRLHMPDIIHLTTHIRFAVLIRVFLHRLKRVPAATTPTSHSIYQLLPEPLVIKATPDESLGTHIPIAPLLSPWKTKHFSLSGCTTIVYPLSLVTFTSWMNLTLLKCLRRVSSDFALGASEGSMEVGLEVEVEGVGGGGRG